MCGENESVQESKGRWGESCQCAWHGYWKLLNEILIKNKNKLFS